MESYTSFKIIVDVKEKMLKLFKFSTKFDLPFLGITTFILRIIDEMYHDIIYVSDAESYFPIKILI